ncbi:hypothetical protein GCM10009623_09960 [Nocardioides aestuarii]|uniref:Secreted protein n=1 Tax=Nocardioides aestuarii TaxID=252231 RepID=A0ABW4TKC8_9ACTN
MTRTRIAAAALAAALPLALVSTVPAHAGDDEQIKRGSCSANADWKLKVKTDNGRLEVEGEVDSNVNGQTWRWSLRHDGRLVDRGRKQTQAPSGSFDVTRRVDNHSGSDKIRFRAVNPDTDEVCVGRMSY